MKHNKQFTGFIIFILSSCYIFCYTVNFSDENYIKKSFFQSFQSGSGELYYNGSNFGYKTNTATIKDYDYKLYQPARLKSNQDFTITFDLKNDSIAESSKELASIGIEIYQKNNLQNRLAAELSVARLEGYFSRTVFSQIVENGEKIASSYSDDLRLPPNVKVKIYFNAEQKVFYISYLNEDSWIAVGSFGIRGVGGDSGNAQWKMRNNGNFLIYLYGFSKNMKIYKGDMQITSLDLEKK